MAEYRALREKHTLLEICKTPELALEVTLQPLTPRHGRGDPLRRHPPAARADGRALRVRQGRGPGHPRAGARRAPTSSGCASSSRRRASATCSRRCGSSAASSTARCRSSASPARRSRSRATSSRAARSRDYRARRSSSCGPSPRRGTLLMGKIAEVVRRYLRAQIDAGAQAVQLFDSWVGALSPDDYRELRACRTCARILKDVEKRACPVIHFGTDTAHAARGAGRGRRHGDRRRLAHRRSTTRGSASATTAPSRATSIRSCSARRARSPAATRARP